METTDHPNVNSPCGDSRADDDKSAIQNGPTDKPAEDAAAQADTSNECNGLEDNDEGDSEIEASFNATGTIVDKGIDQEQSEDWETEISSPCYVVPPKRYLYGKTVFVPSDIHPVSMRRRTPWLQAVEGQFDDAEDS
ncbi:uncharacterized protein LOC135392108 [Ornithodoros turicata]|uniref:uncharacterized protein LOC135392108 n=1 Tax=Ornithodoros turicata TaxID=34597 RepID=UPI0031394E25